MASTRGGRGGIGEPNVRDGRHAGQRTDARLGRRVSDIAREGGGDTGHRLAGGTRARDTPDLAWPSGFASTERDRAALAVMLGLASLTPRRLLGLAGTTGRAAACLESVRAGRAASSRDQALARSVDPSGILARLDEAGARLVTVEQAEYPQELLELFDPPAGLFVRGRSLRELAPRVAIVGARNCSPAGREISSALARGLAAAGVCTVSGGARGIDTAAHRGALASGGTTVMVLGCGIDVDYPRQNAAVIRLVAEAGAVVSEYPPGVPVEPFRFPARNRIVAALSSAVVVVEGASGSGSMITADHALDLGREVFAVPGPVTSELARVPLALIREGATLVRGPDDLLADLGLRPAQREEMSSIQPGGRVGTNPAETAVYSALAGPSAPDRIAAATGLPISDVMSALLGLEIRNLVRAVGGRYERRLNRRE